MPNFDELIRTDKKTPEQIAQLKALMGYVEFSPEEEAQRVANINALNPDGTMTEAFEQAGFVGMAIRAQIGFWVFLMAKKGMSFNEMMNFRLESPGFQDVMSEFHEFVKAHPVDGKDVDVEKNVGEWTEMFMVAAEKFGDVTVPDIDYSDPKEVKKHLLELSTMRQFQINFSQEFSRMVGGPRRAFAAKKAGGVKKLNEIITIPDRVQSFIHGSIQAYYPPTIDSMLKDKVDRTNLNRLAMDRALFIYSHGKTSGGKKVRELTSGQSVEGLYGTLTEVIPPTFSFRQGEAKQLFLNNRLSPERETEFITSMKQRNEELRRAYNQLFSYSPAYDMYSTLPIEVEKVSEKLLYLYAEEDPKEMISKLCSKEQDATRKCLKTLFQPSLEDNTRAKLWELTKIDDPMSIFRIGGKTPEELWGDKVSQLTGSEKTMYYQIRILQEMQYGKQDITCDMYYIDDKFQLSAQKPLLIAKSPKTVYAEAAVFKQVNNLHEKLKGIMDELDETGETGYDTFTKMRNSLKTCLKYTNLKEAGGANCNMKQLQDALTKLEKDAVAYFNDHTGLKGLVKAYKDGGRKRLRISDDLRDILPIEREKLKRITAGHDFFIDDNIHPKVMIPNSYNLNLRWKHLKESAAMRRIPLSDKHLSYEFEPIDQRVRRTEKRGELLQVLQAVVQSDRISPEENRLNSMKGKDGSLQVRLAKKIVTQDYRKKIRNAEKNSFSPRLDDLDKEINDQSFNARFHNKVQKLLKNKIFLDLAYNTPDTCIEVWRKLERVQAMEKHQILSKSDATYKRLKAVYPENFEKRWDNAEERVVIWKRYWKRTNIDQEVRNIRDEVMSQFVEHTDDHQDPVMLRNTASDKLAKVLTQAILKDYARNNNRDKLMEIACSPNSVQEMETYIRDGIRNSNVLDQEASATAFLSNTVNLKKHAVRYIMEGEAKKKGPAAVKAENGVQKNAVKKEPPKPKGISI